MKHRFFSKQVCWRISALQHNRNGLQKFGQYIRDSKVVSCGIREKKEDTWAMGPSLEKSALLLSHLDSKRLAPGTDSLGYSGFKRQRVGKFKNP